MKLKALILLYVLVLLNSCQKWEWDNPYDPACPKDIWTPTDFMAVMEGDLIKLSWHPSKLVISGYILIKVVDNGQEIILPELSAERSSYYDYFPEGGKTHLYKLIAKAASNESNVVTAQIIPLTIAKVKTGVPSSITYNSLSLSGTVESDGGTAITEKGICWALTPNPIFGNNKVISGAASSVFTVQLTGLTFVTRYYYRAYAINEKGIAYGDILSVVTSPTLPLMHTLSVDVFSPTAFAVQISYQDRGAYLTEQGICWSTSPNPTINNSKNSIWGWTGYHATGLTPGTTYYVRAYAITNLGTAYGEELIARTLDN